MKKKLSGDDIFLKINTYNKIFCLQLDLYCDGEKSRVTRSAGIISNKYNQIIVGSSPDALTDERRHCRYEGHAGVRYAYAAVELQSPHIQIKNSIEAG